MPDTQVSHCVFQDCMGRVIVVLVLVGNVSVNKDFTWFSAQHDGFWNTRVGACSIRG